MRSTTFPRFGVLGLLSAVGLLVSDVALAQGVTADPELVRPRFGHREVAGVPTPDQNVRNTVRWGLFAQYQMNPVSAYRQGEEIGDIVANRMAFHAGLSWDVSKIVSLDLTVPFQHNFGSDIPQLEADGFGLGDLGVGLTVTPLRLRNFHLGLRADFMAPTGRREAYMGDTSVRGSAGLLMMGIIGPVDIGFDTIVTARGASDTQQDFTTGSDLSFNQMLRVNIPGAPVSIVQSLYYRGYFSNIFGGGAENALELMGGLQLPIKDWVRVDVMAGRGLNQGFGTTDLRVLAGVVFSKSPRPEPPPAPIEVPVQPPPPPLPPAVEEPPAEAEIVEDEIIIEDPIQFAVGTANILPESLPTLQAVADIMNGNALIGHLVIEGHASFEGDHEYNYNLSTSRAQAVYHQLFLMGVHPSRMSYRGMGEVVPKAEAEHEKDEENHSVNRRVEFHIVKQHSEFDELPEYSPTHPVPWSGEHSTTVQPPSPMELEEQRMREAQEAKDAENADFDTEDDFSFESEEPVDSGENSGQQDSASDAPAEDAAPQETEDTEEFQLDEE